MTRNSTYSDILHASAQRWGLAVLPDRPLIDDATDPYPQPAVVEMLTWQGPQPWRWGRIRIVTLNGQWSYCYTVSDTNHGGGFGPCRKFCEPHPTRDAALAAAVADITAAGRASSELRAWLLGLTRPVQLALFEEA